MTQITVRPVLTKKDEMTFIKFQWDPYQGNQHWVPPLLMDRKKLIDRNHNPFYQHARMEMFLAENDGDVVGRIAAIVNDNHNKEHNENIGFFGFFESIDDQRVASALLDTAKNWLKKQGVKAMRGPASPSVNDDYGLLIDGFDKSPAILMTYNPPYYAKLIEGYGLTKIKDLYAYQVHKDKVLNERLQRVSEAIKQRERVTLRTLNMKNFAAEVVTIRELYTRGWAKNWGSVPMTEAEFAYVAKDLKALVDPEIVFFAEIDGKAVGFGLSLPDYNLLLKDNKRGWLIPALFRILLFRKRIDAVRIMILGVLPEYAKSGIGGLLFYETAIRCIRRGYPQGEASWVLEDNLMMNRGAEMLNAEKTKTYRLYQMPL
jgi:GNAT superfamily N-acetyltransferase